ncbi:hypothetical protein B0I08_107211 [Glaciihabitans tibetensis]|uniref:LysM domain-containing protein n=1 Tax=Glaciihabitans tibetensis TaxID=1266600 RepID=A0A2T0VAY2_9MICO|nr:hypothetical protein [Glaciihabitans tibetensis]PRY67314.1 hypothetical protein B0I08_107211 [Glaciihabitans tibetensis]
MTPHLPFVRRARYPFLPALAGRTVGGRRVVARSLASASVAASCVVMLSGCLGTTTTSLESPTPVPTVTITAAPAPAVTVTAVPEPTVVELPVEVPVEVPVETVPDPEVIPEEADIVLTTPVDNGVVAHAAGTVEPDASGNPYRYTVAAGDIAVEICTRFARYIWQLADKNGATLANPYLIHEGDTILLTANPLPEGYVIPTR